MKTKLFCGIALLTACTMMMVGCKKDNSIQPEPEAGPGPDTETPVAAKAAVAVLEYSFNVTDSMLLVADFNVSYYDSEGKIQTEPLTTNKWSKTMMAPLPAKLGTRVTWALKEGFDAADFEKVTIRKNYKSCDYCVDEKGNVVGEKDLDGDISSTPLMGDQLADFIKKRDYFLQRLYSYSADGKITYLSNWE